MSAKALPPAVRMIPASLADATVVLAAPSRAPGISNGSRRPLVSYWACDGGGSWRPSSAVGVADGAPPGVGAFAPAPGFPGGAGAGAGDEADGERPQADSTRTRPAALSRTKCLVMSLPRWWCGRSPAALPGLGHGSRSDRTVHVGGERQIRLDERRVPLRGTGELPIDDVDDPRNAGDALEELAVLVISSLRRHGDRDLREIVAHLRLLGLEQCHAQARLEGGVRQRPIERGHFLLGGKLVLDDVDLLLQLGDLGPEAAQVGDDSAAFGDFALDGRVLRAASPDAGLDRREQEVVGQADDEDGAHGPQQDLLRSGRVDDGIEERGQRHGQISNRQVTSKVTGRGFLTRSDLAITMSMSLNLPDPRRLVMKSET